MKKLAFDTIDSKGNKITLETWEVTPKVQAESEIYANKAFQSAIKEGHILACEIDSILESRGFNFQNEEDQHVALDKEIREKIVTLKSGRKGNQKLTKMEGRTLAIDIKKLRARVDSVGSARNDLYSKTAERVADVERWYYFIFGTIINPATNRTYFKSFEEFKEMQTEQIVRDAMVNFAKIRDIKVELNNPEDKWLIKFGFMNDEGDLINENGELVDTEFRRINDQGHFLNSTGARVDIYGNLLDADGSLLVPEDSSAYSE